MRGVKCIFFFFSSRRRHTRWPRDWSSDVCSSDLGPERQPGGNPPGQVVHPDIRATGLWVFDVHGDAAAVVGKTGAPVQAGWSDRFDRLSRSVRPDQLRSDAGGSLIYERSVVRGGEDPETSVREVLDLLSDGKCLPAELDPLR